MKGINNRISSLVVAGVIAFIAALLTEIIAVDLIDQSIQAGITSESIGDVTTINYILAMYIIAMFGGFVLSAAWIFKDWKAIIATCIATIVSWCIVYVISLVALYGFPNFDLNASNVAIVPALFATFILRDPTAFITITAIVMVASNSIFNFAIVEV